jgi:hypothetical protein
LCQCGSVRKEIHMSLEMLPVAVGVLVTPLIIIMIAKEMKRLRELKKKEV